MTQSQRRHVELDSSEPEGSADADSSAAGQQRWERLYRQVTEERDRLQAEVETLREERDLYRKSLSAVMREEFTFDKQTLLNRDPSKPTLEQLLKELEQARGMERVVCILGIKPLPGHPLGRER